MNFPCNCCLLTSNIYLLYQTLESRTGVEVLYALTDLLSFYEQTFTRIIPIENAVHSAVKGCHLECRRLFISGLNKQSDALQHTPLTYPLDLTAAHSTKECCRCVHHSLLLITSTKFSFPGSELLTKACVVKI